MQWPNPWLLAAASAFAVLSVVPLRAREASEGGSGESWGPRAGAGARSLLVLSIVLGFLAQHRLDRIGSAWDSVWAEREAEAAAALGRELDRRVAAGEALVEALAEEPYASGGEAGPLRLLRERYGVDAVAVFDSRGELQVWDGDHRGAVPEEVRLGTAPFAYGDRPLFSYLYFTRSIPSTGGTAVAAMLLDASPPPGIQQGGTSVLASVEDRTGVELVVSGPDRVEGEAVWDFRWEGRPLFSVVMGEPFQADEREAILARWQRWIGGALAGAWLLLALSVGAWRNGPVLSVAVLMAASMVLPLGRLFGAEELASPTSFLLAPPLDATLLRTLAVAGTALVGLAVAHTWSRGLSTGSPETRAPRSRFLVAAGAAIVAVGFPVAAGIVSDAPSTSFLAGSEMAFLLVQLLLALLLGGLALVGSTLLSSTGRSDRRRGTQAAVGLSVAVLLAALLASWSVYQGGTHVVWAALWLVPVLLFARGRPALEDRYGSLATWIGAGVLGITCALPFAWDARIEARVELGETRLARLGSTADPFTEYLLQRFSEAVDSLDARGAEPVEILYRSWAASGMAEEGVRSWITHWSPGDIPREELRIGLPPPRPTAADEFLAEARLSASPVVRRLRRPDARYVVVVPLSSGAAVTAVVPPASAAPAPTGVTPLFAAGSSASRDAIEVVPLLPGDPLVGPDSTQWTRTADGWRGERTLELLDGPYHTHYTIDLPRPSLMAARGSLLFIMDLGILGLLLGGGMLLVPGRAVPLRRVRDWLWTFQGRVTLALFAFFLLSVALLGLVGYQTLAGASTRTAQALADRATEEAVGWYLEVQGSTELLARRVGADLLHYREGRLIGGSTAETVELGLYEGWIPHDVHRAMVSREALRGASEQSVGSWEYVVSYRRMPDGSVLGAPVSLEAGDVALRRREMMDLLGFSLLLGAVLSLGLAVLVGRTLVRPLRELSQATGRVGLGDLSARLPTSRSDEFGAVFDDFNQMVARLREARRDLVRTERILAWGEMARQVAHEVKNPLTPIKLSVQHIRRAFEDRHAEFPAILRRNVEATLKEIDRLDAIARSFSRFGAPDDSTAQPLEPTNVEEVVDETLDLYSSHEGSIRFEGSVAADLPPVTARPDELKEVLVNLLENARSAMTGPGVVRVEAEGKRSNGAVADDSVELRVSDDGPGIPEELLPRVFEPRFSTRSAGTGLGLAIVRRLVESWGGRVHATSRPGKGATFVIELSRWYEKGPNGPSDAEGVLTP